MVDWALLDPVERSAAMVLWWRAAESKAADPLWRDPAAEAAVTGWSPWPSSPSGSLFADLVALRTAALDARTREALDGGLRQVVTLGAGLDTRFWRVPPPAGTRVIELDTPAVNALAARVLPSAPWASRRPCRLPGGLPAALDGAGLAGPILWLAEGLVEYLPGPLWRGLARVMTERSPRGSTALVTCLGPGLPARVAGDPTFPFVSLPHPHALAIALRGWTTCVHEVPTARGVPPGANLILWARRS